MVGIAHPAHGTRWQRKRAATAIKAHTGCDGGGRPRREQPQRGVGAPPATHLLQVESPCEGPLQPTGARALAAGLWRGGVGVVCVCVCV
jgi:hypothetical protein